MQYIPCNSALLAQKTLFLTQKGTVFQIYKSFGIWEDLPPHVGKNSQIISFFFMRAYLSQIIGKIIDIKKLNLEFIDQIINIGKCIEFDPIYTRKTKPCYFVLLKSFLQLLNAVQRFLQPFRAVLANLISKLDFLT